MFRLKQYETPVQQVMYVGCNSCGKETLFQGVFCPITCKHCNEIVPDALDLHYSAKERIVYHYDEEIYD